jgi:hypothetical protein
MTLKEVANSAESEKVLLPASGSVRHTPIKIEHDPAAATIPRLQSFEEIVDDYRATLTGLSASEEDIDEVSGDQVALMQEMEAWSKIMDTLIALAKAFDKENWPIFCSYLKDVVALLPEGHGRMAARALLTLLESNPNNAPAKMTISAMLAPVYAPVSLWSLTQSVCDQAYMRHADKVEWPNLGIFTAGPIPCAVPSCKAGNCHMVKLVQEMMRTPSILGKQTGIDFVELSEEVMPQHVIAGHVRAGLESDQIVIIRGRLDGTSLELNVAGLESIFGSGEVLEVYRE